MESQSILDVLLAYKSHLESIEKPLKANQVYSQTKSSIVRHLIPGWDELLMPSSSRQLTKIETDRIQEFLGKTSVSKLNEALKIQERVFEKYSVKPSSRNVYKSRLENFINWVREQGWIKSSSGCSPSRRTPKMRYGHGSNSKKLLTNKPAKLGGYSLKTHSSWNTQKVEKIVEEVNQFYDCLVMALSPKNENNFVFIGSRKGQPYDGRHFSRFFKGSAHRLTGQLLTPHLLRDIYASWFLDHAYTEDVIRSLAYAMGHSPEELRKTYDKRKAQQKHEPIQKKLDETLNQLFGFNDELKVVTINAPPEGIDPALWAILTPEQKTMYQKLKER
jgi:hypothetical protein